MKSNYFELLSQEPIHIKKVGGVISPRLRDIASVGINTYQYFLSILLMDSDIYFDLFTINESMSAPLQNALNFFIKEDVAYSASHKCFLTTGNNFTGIINKDVYPQVCDLIFRRNYIKSEANEDLSKIDNPKTLEIMQKIKQGRALKEKHTEKNDNMELGNIISAVANKSSSLNILNIWDLTIFQLWDCFMRLSNNSVYDIQSMSVAAWGNKDNYFDAASWFKRIYNN